MKRITYKIYDEMSISKIEVLRFKIDKTPAHEFTKKSFQDFKFSGLNESIEAGFHLNLKFL